MDPDIRERPATTGDLSVSENLAGLQRETTALSERTSALRNTHTMYPDDA